MLLEVEGLCVNYGQIEAIRDISFGVEEGTLATLIGANGAGKTTTLKTISGLRKVRAGRVLFDGKDISLVPPYERVQLGISQSPEGRGCFPGMTVRENLDMGAYVRKDRKTPAYQADLDRGRDAFDRGDGPVVHVDVLELKKHRRRLRGRPRSREGSAGCRAAAPPRSSRRSPARRCGRTRSSPDPCRAR